MCRKGALQSHREQPFRGKLRQTLPSSNYLINGFESFECIPSSKLPIYRMFGSCSEQGLNSVGTSTPRNSLSAQPQEITWSFSRDVSCWFSGVQQFFYASVAFILVCYEKIRFSSFKSALIQWSGLQLQGKSITHKYKRGTYSGRQT